MSDDTHDTAGLDEEMLELIRSFVEESRDVTASVEPLLIGLVDDATAAETIPSSLAAIFRALHSMKGSAGFLGFDRITTLTHAAESLLSLLRDRPDALRAEHVDELCRTIDVATQLLDRVDQTLDDGTQSTEQDGIDVEGGVARLEVLLKGMDESEPATSDNAPPASEMESFSAEARRPLGALEQLGHSLGNVSSADFAEAFRQLRSFKGSCGSAGLGELESVADRLEDLLGALRDGGVDPSPTVADAILAAGDAMAETVGTLPGSAGVIENKGAILAGIDRAFEHANARKSKRLGEILLDSGSVSLDQLKEALSYQSRPLGEVLTKLGFTTEERIEEALDRQSDLPRCEETPVPPPVVAPMLQQQRSRYIRVDVDKLDALLDQVGELITASATITQNDVFGDEGMEHLQQPVAHLNRVTGGLHDTAMSMRMVPLAQTFRKMMRVVRDVSRRVEKDVSLVLEGEDTAVDKSVIESLADPLVHILRNAIDHGIESAEDRTKAGKDEKGTVTLSARHEGSEVWIVVEDDGGGIDPERLIRKARKMGLLSAENEAVSDQQAYELLFAPGLSTAEKVSGVSGRGVGMDVVKRNIENLRGRIDVHSVRGKGTEFVIRIPLTLAIIDAMLVRVGGRVYAVPLLSIRESVKVKPEQIIELADGSTAVRIREEVLGVLALHDLHAVPCARTDACEGIFVLVEEGDRSLAILVDQIVGQRQIVIKPLGMFLDSIHGVSGCSVTGTGEITLILDVGALIRGRPEALPELDVA